MSFGRATSIPSEGLHAGGFGREQKEDDAWRLGGALSSSKAPASAHRTSPAPLRPLVSHPTAGRSRQFIHTFQDPDGKALRACGDVLLLPNPASGPLIYGSTPAHGDVEGFTGSQAMITRQSELRCSLFLPGFRRLLCGSSWARSCGLERVESEFHISHSTTVPARAQSRVEVRRRTSMARRYDIDSTSTSKTQLPRSSVSRHIGQGPVLPFQTSSKVDRAICYVAVQNRTGAVPVECI